MKNNYQKIIAILYLLIVVGFSFYTPLYRYNSDLEFGSLWSNKVDWFKFGYIFFFINLLFILLFYFFRNKPNPDVNSPIFKRKLKRELKVFAIGIIAFVAFLGFIEVFNLYQEKKKETLTIIIENQKETLVVYTEKVKKRKEFMSQVENVFNLSKYNGNVADFWNNSLKNSNDSVWVNYFINTFNQQQNEFMLTDKEFRSLLKNLHLTNKVINEANKKLAYIKSKEDKKANLFFFVRDGYTKSVFLFLIIELVVLYILRYSYYGVRSLNTYLKEE